LKKYSREILKQEFNITSDVICIDLCCGSRKQEGHIGVDRNQIHGVDIVLDIEEGLPFEDNTIDRVYANFLL
jgi:predicted SAM-dependent methyltransferase